MRAIQLNLPRVSLPPAYDVPALTAADVEALEATTETDLYFRIAHSDADILTECSVEDAFGTPDEIAERFGFESAADLQEHLARWDSTFPECHWDDEGHLGAGVYYDGVCCCEGLEALADYAMSRAWAQPGDFVWVFTGNYVGSCPDGSVVNPTRVLGILSLRELVHVYWNMHRDNLTNGMSECLLSPYWENSSISQTGVLRALGQL